MRSLPSAFRLFSPIFLFSGRKLHRGRLERGDFQVTPQSEHTIISPTSVPSARLDFRSTFGTRYSSHVYSPLILSKFDFLTDWGLVPPIAFLF